MKYAQIKLEAVESVQNVEEQDPSVGKVDSAPFEQIIPVHHVVFTAAGLHLTTRFKP